MFKNEYQGGPFVEIFNASGKDVVGKSKNSAAKRIYDKDAKGFIYTLEGSTATSKLSFPITESKQLLCLIQRFLIMQVYVPLSKDFAIELVMSDIGNNKRRAVISTSIKEISATPLHAKLPLSFIKRDIWLNLTFDLISMVSDVFPTQTFRSLDAFSISGTCKIRRVFTMKLQPYDSCDYHVTKRNQSESIPISLQFASNVSFESQLISVSTIRSHLETKVSRSDGTSGYWSSSSEDLSNARRTSAKEHQPTHIAFGTKVPFELSRSVNNKNALSSARRERTSVFDSSDMSTNRSTYRQSRSSKTRLSVQANTKPNSVCNEHIASESSLKRCENEQDVSGIKTTTSQTRVNSEVENLPLKLLNLVDELESLNGDESPLSDGKDEEKENVFQFSSQPHLVPRIRTESGSTISRREFQLVGEIAESSSDSDQDFQDRIHRRIVRNTPSPRLSRVINPLLRVSKNFSDKNRELKDVMQPQSSLSPDISRLHSPSPTVYDSTRYTDSSSQANKPPLNRSIISLRSSDATLTASMDTLVQCPINETGERIHDNKLTKGSYTDFGDDEENLPQNQVFNGSHSNIVLSRKSIREIPHALDQVQANIPESTGFQVGNESFEAAVLESMRRGMEEEEEDGMSEKRLEEKINYEDHFNDSFDISWSTYQHPPPMHPQAYDVEMQKNNPSFHKANLNGSTLGLSNPRDWANLLSPPMVLPSVRTQQKKESLSDVESVGNDGDVMGLSDGSSSVSIKSSTTGGDIDEEDMLDLMYDPCLNCYFDPKSGKYYELKN